MLQPAVLLDVLVILALLVTAGAALLSRDLFRGVVLFIAFGLVMSLAWVRLQAPDLALAEAAIGAGLAGALLLDAVGQLRDPERSPERLLPWATASLCLVLLAALASAVLTHSAPPPTLAEALDAAMDESGVSHPVTAVLLNFRGYDTFLEVSVLAVAAFISMALQPLSPEAPPLHQISNRLLDALVIWLGPIMLMVAVYLFWAGSKQPGGAFQAGAVLAASGVLLRLAGVRLPFLSPGFGLRMSLVAGLTVFLLAALIGPFLGLPLFSYPPAIAGTVIIVVEALLTFSIGITLLSLFTAAPPSGSEQSHER